ncbi:LacI family DNA-binding transcriptional regulator [Tessaracoccus lubricantis]|uniref:LacI family DNA-binding transcriptional regulator n=1 Tax=Tessaracoccus lubricantis TaxID=545543 RepID=A0ABP9F3Q0_9ACTN
MRPATLKAVAAEAGVSLSTASKALNGRDEVGAATRERVLAAAEKLAFTPNPMARSLAAAQSGTVGLLASDLDGRFSIPILMGAEDAFGAERMSVFLCDAREDAIRERHHLQALLARRIDGLIVVGSRTDPRPSLGKDLPVPVVYAYAPSDDPSDTSLVPDNVSAGAMAIEHLLSLGRTKIAHIHGNDTYAAAHDRAVGIRQALGEAGLQLLPPYTFGAWSEAWGRAAAKSILAQSPDVDAIVCASDQIARGAIDSLHSLGVSIPDDIAVVSFDNWEILATGSLPQLTSVDMNFEALGRLAAQRVFDSLAGKQFEGVEALPCRLVVRGSSVAGATS